MDDKQKKVVSSIIKDFQKKNKRDPKDQKELAQFVQSQGGKKYIERKTQEVLGKQSQEQPQEQTTEQKQIALHGAKLNYFKSLKHQCPEGEELYYYKKGGSVGCGCKKKEDGGEVRKAGLGCSAVEKFKKMKSGKKITIKQQPQINSSDTVHVNGIAYSVTNSNGSPVDKRFKPYSGKVEEEDRKKAKKGDKDAQKRQLKQDLASSEKCGGKVKKHQGGGWLQRGIANPYISITEGVVNPDNKYQWVKRTINSNPGGLPNDTIYKAGSKSGFPKDQNSLKELFNSHYIEDPEWNKKQNVALFLQKIINTKLKGDKLMNGYIPRVK